MLIDADMFERYRQELVDVVHELGASKTKHTHDPMDDARSNAEALL